MSSRSWKSFIRDGPSSRAIARRKDSAEPRPSSSASTNSSTRTSRPTNNGGLTPKLGVKGFSWACTSLVVRLETFRPFRGDSIPVSRFDEIAGSWRSRGFMS